MNRIGKRIGAVLLTLAMLATMLPAVAAATTLTTSVTGLTATWEYSNQGGGSATWTAGGTTISATSKGGPAKTNISVLTLKNELGTEAELRFNYTISQYSDDVKKCANLTIANGADAITHTSLAAVSDTYSVTLADKDVVTITFQSPKGAGSSVTFTITDLALVSTAASDPTLTFKTAEGGSYTVDGEPITAEVSRQVALNTVLSLSATPDAGYVFYGWYNETNAVYLTQDAACNLTASEDATVYPVFIPDTMALFQVGAVRYYSLHEAAAAAAASADHKTVVLLNDGVLSGTHTIPAGVTLLIPYDDKNSMHGAVPACTSSTSNLVPWEEPTAYRTLTMAADATIIVEGALEVGGRHSAASGTAGQYAAPTGSLGFIAMTAGSHIEVRGDLYCWGYIYGDGTVTAKDGGNIYEVFQITDFRGGNFTLALAADMMVFPISQYYVQNVEVATTYEYGAIAYVMTSAYAQDQCITAPPIKFIGENAMFQPAEGSYIVKKYDSEEDILRLEAYGDCSLSPMSVDIGGSFPALGSGDFVLPITNNIHITIKSGTASLRQDVVMLPGSSLTIDENATLKVEYTDAASIFFSELLGVSGHNLILFDSENWFNGLDLRLFLEEGIVEMVNGLHYVHQGRYLIPAPYVTGDRRIRTTADIKDVVLNVNGTLQSDGYIYSTVLWNDELMISSGGANVISSKGTGEIYLNCGSMDDLAFLPLYDQQKDAAYQLELQAKQEAGEDVVFETLYYVIPLASVQLTNGENTLADAQMVDTSFAEPGTVYDYCAVHDHWYTGACDLPAPYTITWVMGEDTVTTLVMPDQTPVYAGATPTKEYDDDAHYLFVGWSATADGAAIDLPAATADATYYAAFTAVTHTYGTAATDGYHACACGKTAACADEDADGDHLCDRGCGALLTAHTGGTATCAKQAVCTECGDSYGELLPHTPGDAADCDTPQTCSACGAELNAALGHDYEAVVTAPDCENGGYTTYTCAVCGDTYIADETAPNGHDHEAVVTAPDCVNGGYTTYTCTVCGDTYVADETAPNGHDHEAVVTAPDCENGGYTTYTCTVCGDTYVTDETAPNGHDHEAVVTAPDCVNGGYTTHTCTVCGDTYVDTYVDALDHVWDNDCDTLCNRCPATREPKHSYDDDTDAECNTCDHIRRVDYTVVSFTGNSVAEDVRGLAFHFAAAVKDMTMNEAYEADYAAGATITPHSLAVDARLVTLGTIVSNDTVALTLENTTVNKHTVDVPALLLLDIHADTATVDYAVRVCHIPDDKRDATVRARPYAVYEVDGVEIVVYGDEVSASITGVLAAG